MVEIFDNIREIYDFHEPCEGLRSFVEFFSESSPDRTSMLAAGRPFRIEMFPSWTPTFWINLGAPYRLTAGQRQHHIPQHSDVLVLRDAPTIRHNDPGDHLFTVKFYPGGLESILGVNQTQFIGKVVPLAVLLPPRLILDVKTANTANQRIDLLEHYFLQALQSRPRRDHYTKLVAESIGLFSATSMLPNTSQLAEKVFVHSRTINRYFHRVIGLPPKKFLGMTRARTALTRYLADPGNFAPEAFGYYDRSHFYKSIRQFAGRRLG